MPDQRRRLDVVADLVVHHDLGEFAVTGSGERIVIDLPGLSLGGKLARLGRGQVGTQGLQVCDRALKSAGLSLDIRMNKRRVARLGAGAHPRLLDHLFNLAPMQVSGWALARSLIRG
jgi:hypothetical protein